MSEKLKEKYITEDGIELMLKRINPSFIEAALSNIATEFKERGEPIEVPKGFLVTLKGTPQEGKEEFDLNENNLADEDPIQERRNRSLWAQHQDALVKLAEARAEREFKLLFQLGIDYDPETCEEQWKEWELECEIAGFLIPESPVEKKFAFLWHKLLSPYDVLILRQDLELINQGRILTPQQRHQFRESVQSAVGNASRTQLKRALREIEAGGLVGESEAGADDSGSEVGPDTEAMGQDGGLGEGRDDASGGNADEDGGLGEQGARQEA